MKKWVTDINTGFGIVNLYNTYQELVVDLTLGYGICSMVELVRKKALDKLSPV